MAHPHAPKSFVFATVHALVADRLKRQRVQTRFNLAGNEASRRVFFSASDPQHANDLWSVHIDKPWPEARWTLQGGPKPEFLQAPVAYYVMGAECWRFAQTLEEATSHHEIYFLNSTGNANDVF